MKTTAAAGVAATSFASQDVKKIKVGVIGCGSVSGSYLPVMIESPYIELVSACDLCTPKRKLTDGTDVDVEVSDNDMLIMDHGNGVLSHVQSGYNYGSADGHSGRTDQYTIDFWGTEGDMHLCGYDWGPHGVDVATMKEPKRRFVEDPAGYKWQNGAAHIAECLATGKQSILTPEHAFHVLEIMEGCHISQQTGKRIPIQSTFKWPIFS